MITARAAQLIQGAQVDANAHEAFELYATGISLHKVARTMGVSHTTVWRWVKATMDHLAKERVELGATILERDLKIIDTLIEKCLRDLDREVHVTRVRRGKATVTIQDHVLNPKIGALLIKALERRHRLLGLNAPETTNVAHSVSLVDLLQAPSHPQIPAGETFDQGGDPNGPEDHSRPEHGDQGGEDPEIPDGGGPASGGGDSDGDSSAGEADASSGVAGAEEDDGAQGGEDGRD